MPDERDRRRLITPPAGVRAQTAPESWEERDSHTPVDSAPDPDGTIERISRRVKLTARTSQSTLDNVAELRRDFDAKLGRLEDKVSELSGELGGVLRGALAEERTERQRLTAIAVSSLQSDLDVGRARGLSAIEMERTAAAAELEARKAASDYRRQLILKVIGGFAAVWALVSTILLARCR